MEAWVVVVYVVGFLSTLVLTTWWMVFHEDGSSDDAALAVMIATIWPVGLPMLGAIVLTTLTVRKIRGW